MYNEAYRPQLFLVHHGFYGTCHGSGSRKNSITFRSGDSDLVEILPETLFVKTYRQVSMDVSMYNGVPLPYMRRHGVK